MTDEQWQAAWKLYQSGSSVPPEQIPSFLNRAATDLQVRDAVLAMLDGSGKGESLDRIGQRIGRYILTQRVGGGGMGEVYAARDSELGRPVAVKLLMQSAIGKSSPVDRFIHEAKAASSLNHPNIVTIYEVIHAESRLAIVMELVDGMALRQLCGSPLPVDRVLHLGEQIARALSAAHARGIVHCDIKPENLMVRQDGLVKVLDFGLARDLGSLAASSVFAAGTLRYMSPEQSRGEAPSAASDVFSLGIVLYELAAGVHPFDSGSIFDGLTALNRTEPPAPSSLNSFVPGHLDGVILSMLAKDPGARPSAADVAQMLGSRFSSLPAALPASGTASHKERETVSLRARVARRGIPIWMAAMAAILALALGFLFSSSTHPVAAPLIRFSVALGPEAIPGQNLTAAVSPDGRLLAYQVRSSADSKMLATQPLDQSRPTVLAGTEGAIDPFFSPDSQWIGFFTYRNLKKVPVNGGAAVTLCDVGGAPRGAAWASDGYIIANLDNSHLARIPEGGGKPEMLSSRPEEHGEQTWRWPQVLPGGRRVLFTGSRGSGVGAGYEDANIEVLSLDTGKVTVVYRGGYFGRYLPSGHLVYVHQGTLFAVPLDLGDLKIRGVPIPILDDVASEVDRAAGQLDFSTARDKPGIFVYRSGRPGEGARELAWMDTAGKTRMLLSAAAPPITPRISPDGKFVALSAGGNILVHDADRGLTTPLTRNGLLNNSPVWTPDGKHLIFSQQGGGESAIWWIRADGSGQPQKLFATPAGLRVRSISPDGRRIAFARQDANTGWDIWTLPLDLMDPDRPKPGEPEPFLREPGNQDYPAFSPDGRWIAYSSSIGNDITEAYVRPFPVDPSGRKWQVSTNRGRFPVWSRDGKELLFLAKDDRVVGVSYKAEGPVFSAGRPEVWSPSPISSTSMYWNFDLAPDGKRIVTSPEAVKAGDERGSVHVTVLLNFFDELKRRLP